MTATAMALDRLQVRNFRVPAGWVVMSLRWVTWTTANTRAGEHWSAQGQRHRRLNQTPSGFRFPRHESHSLSEVVSTIAATAVIRSY